MLREARETADIEIFQSACQNVTERRELSVVSRERFHSIINHFTHQW